VLWAIPAALSGTLGLYAYYRGMATGTMAVVAPIAGASAVVPVVFGIATGDRPHGVQIAGIACAIVGVALAAQEHQTGERRLAAGVGLAILAAIGFGFYFPPMHAAGEADAWWASLVFRISSTLIVVGAVVIRRPRLRLRGRPLLVVAGVGVGDTLGNLLFAASSGHGIVSLTSVLASLYPVVTVLLAAVVLKERVARAQLAGIVLTLTGVGLISA
jgi:drug/metabolite transporter (DMT)-like permease